MTRLHQLGSKLEHLPAILADYEAEINKAEPLLQIKGKMLQQALAEQPGWACYYGQLKVELKSIVKEIEMKVAAKRGELFQRFNENHSRELGERVIGQYINNHFEYLNVYAIQLEVEEVYEKASEVVAGFEKRGFALRDLTAARVAEVQDYTIL